MHSSQGTPNVLANSLQSTFGALACKQIDTAKDISIVQSSENMHQTYVQLCQQRGLEIDKILIFQSMKIREKNWVEVELDREIGVEMFKVVCEVMKINKFYLSLKGKNFEINSTHFQILDALIKDKLIELSMNNCNLSTNAMQSLSNLIKNKQCKIQKLKIINNQIGYDGACILQDALNYHKYIKYIYIEYCSIDNQIITQIMNAAETIPNLQFLSLEGNKIEYLGFQIILETIKKNPNIKQLYIRNNPISDESINLLQSDFFTIPDVDFSNCNLTFAGINDLLKKIDNLNLSNTKLGDQVVDTLVSALKSRNSQLKFIDLSSNYITDQGAVKILELIKSSPNLQIQRINLMGNHISEQCENYLIQNTQQLGIAHKLKLGQQQTNLTNPQVQYLENHYQEFETISKKVNSLWVNLQLFYAGLSLTHFFYRKIMQRNLRDAILILAGLLNQQFKKFNKEPVKHVVINQTNIGVNEIETIQILVKSVPSIENLTIANCDFVNYSQLTLLQSNRSESYQNYQQQAQNKDYELDMNIIFNKIGEIISDNNNVKNLELSNLKITTYRMKNLLEFLKFTNKQIRIDYSKNLIDDEGFAQILEYQKLFSNKFQHIILPNNNLSSRVLPMLIDHLRQNQNQSRIEEIVLDGLNGVQANNIGEFFYGLSQFQPKIVCLSLCDIRINDSVAQTISYFIKNSQYLEEINLSFNDLKDNGAKIIIEGAWANQYRLTRLSLLGNYFSKQFSSSIQKYNQKNQNKVQILIEPSLVVSSQQHDSQQNGFNTENENQIRVIQHGSSLQAINDEDSEMPMVEQSVKHDELSNYLNGTNQNIPNADNPYVNVNTLPNTSQVSQQQQYPTQLINSKNFAYSTDQNDEYPYNQSNQSKHQLSQGKIPSQLEDYQARIYQNPSNSKGQTNETTDMNIGSVQNQRSQTELQKSPTRDNMTFGGNSIVNSNYRSERDYMQMPYQDQQQQQQQQQVYFKQNATSTTSLENQNNPKNNNGQHIENYIRQIHQIESHIRDLFEKQTQLVDEIKQKISQEPQNRSARIGGQEPSNKEFIDQQSQRSLSKYSQNNLNNEIESIKRASHKSNQKPQSFQNLPSEQFFNIDDQNQRKNKTLNNLGQASGLNNDLNQQYGNNLQPYRQNPVHLNQPYYQTTSNNHLPRSIPQSSRAFEVPETQTVQETQKVAHSLTALQEKIQDLEEKLERESQRQIKQDQDIESSEILDYKPQRGEEKVLRSSNNGLTQYQKKAPSSVIGSTYNEILFPVSQQQVANPPKSQYTVTTIPTENNIDQVSISQNINKYSSKYNPQIQQTRPKSVSKMHQNINNQNKLNLPIEENQDRKQSILSVVQTESHIAIPNESNMRQTRDVQNGDKEKVKHSHQRPASQQKYGQQQPQPPVSMIQMEDVAMNLNSSPYKQQAHNESRINQDKEIQQYLNQQQQLNYTPQQKRIDYNNTHSPYQSINQQPNYNIYNSQRHESPHKIQSKQKMNVSQQSNSPSSQVKTSQSSPSKNGMRNSRIGNKNLSFSKRRDNVMYLVEELIKLIERYEYLIEMCSELKQIKKKVNDNLGGGYNYNQINNNNLQKLCGVESDLRDKMRTQERQIYESINELREIGLVIDDSKLLNWDNLKIVLSNAAIEYEKNQQQQQYGEISSYKQQDSILDNHLQNSQYQMSSHKKNPSFYSTNYQIHS